MEGRAGGIGCNPTALATCEDVTVAVRSGEILARGGKLTKLYWKGKDELRCLEGVMGLVPVNQLTEKKKWVCCENFLIDYGVLLQSKKWTDERVEYG